jgi:hypothetical protein
VEVGELQDLQEEEVEGEGEHLPYLGEAEEEGEGQHQEGAELEEGAGLECQHIGQVKKRRREG